MLQGKVLNTKCTKWRSDIRAGLRESAGHDGRRGCGQVLSNVFEHGHKVIQLLRANTFVGCDVVLKMGERERGKGRKGEF